MMTQGELQALVETTTGNIMARLSVLHTETDLRSEIQSYIYHAIHLVDDSSRSYQPVDALTKQFLTISGIPDPEGSDYENLTIAMRALLIAHERNIRYKDSWKQAGWRGAVFDIRKKAERLFRQFFGPMTREMMETDFGEDDAYDLINFAIFFLRARAEKNEWGKWL